MEKKNIYFCILSVIGEYSIDMKLHELNMIDINHLVYFEFTKFFFSIPCLVILGIKTACL